MPGPYAGTRHMPRIGVTAVLETRQFNRDFREHMARLKRMEVVQERIATAVERSSSRQERVTARATESMSRVLRRHRFELVTMMFFLRLLARVTQATFKAMQEASESTALREGVRTLARSYEVNVGRISGAMRGMADGTIGVRKSLQIAQSGLLVDQGQFSEQYAKLWEAARVAAVVGGADAEEAFEAMIESLAAGTGEAIDSATNIYQVRLALQKYAESIGKTVKQLEHMEAAEVILNTVLSKSDELMEGGAETALMAAAAYERLAASWENFKDVIGVILEAGEAIEWLAKSIDVLSKAVILWSAASAASNELAREGVTRAELMAMSYEDMILATEKGTEKFKKGMEALGYFNDEVEEGERVYERYQKRMEKEIDLDPIIDHLLKREEIIEKHQHRIGQLELQYTNRLEDIGFRFRQAVARAERQARRERLRAQRAFARRVLRETEQYNLEQSQKQRRFDQKITQDRARYRLESLHNEALYLYERGQLVAEGDVLAIEDLDARYDLERRAREDNQKLQERQMKEQFALQQRFMMETFELQLRQLTRALDDQLMEIDIRERERQQEAEERRIEDQRKAARDHEQRLAEEQYNHDQSLKQWRHYWTSIAKQTEASSEQITEILRKYFGAGGIADTIIEGYQARHLRREAIRADVERIMGPYSTEWGQPSRGQPTWRWESYAPEGYSGQQFGGEGVASRPTMFEAGRHGPEAYSFRPLSPIGGSLALSWQGPAIPIQGTGQMAGADLTGVGDAIAQGLILELRNQLLER